VVIVYGILVNHVPPGPILAGMHYYLRPIPFFLVPAVFNFTDRQLKQLLGLLLGLSLLQVPIACYRRNVVAHTGHVSGDAVFGIMSSGDLSIFLICELCIAAAMVLRGAMGRLTFPCLFVTFVIPMSINETKITVFALPLGLLVTVIVGSERGKRLAVTGYALALLTAGALIFVPLYDFFNTYNNNDVNHPERIEDFLLKPDKMANYLDTKATVGSKKEAGRVDALIIPLQVLANDPAQLGFGLGLGNAPTRALGHSSPVNMNPSMASIPLKLPWRRLSSKQAFSEACLCFSCTG
jgi:hypothetical protein